MRDAVAVLLDDRRAVVSFLDNAPTYLTFVATASGLDDVSLEGRYLVELPGDRPRAPR